MNLKPTSKGYADEPLRRGEGNICELPTGSGGALPEESRQNGYVQRISRLRAAVPQFDRRTMLKTMGASLALAGLAGCKGEADETALPYVRHPEGTTVGKARWYATAVTFSGYAQPVLGKTYAGRPVKLEGNPDHPVTRGKSDAFTQAALLDLYDPARSQSPLRNGRNVSWSDFDREAHALAERHDATGGEGFRLLTGPLSSHTMQRQIAAMMARWPNARWHVSDPGRPAEWGWASHQMFGMMLDQHPAIDSAETVVSFDGDFLGPGPRQTPNARLFGEARVARRGEARTFRLFVAEPAPSMTGAMADRRLAAGPHDIGRLLAALAEAIEDGAPGPAPNLSETERQWISDAAAALTNAGRQGLVLAGEYLPAELQVLAMQINGRLGALGRTMHFAEPVLAEPPDGRDSLRSLVDAISAGDVSALAMIGVNPAYAAPDDLNFAEAIRTVEMSIHAGLHTDETSALCNWHLPLQHCLESWGDARAADGSATIIQPLVRPFYDVRADTVILENLMGESASDRALVMRTWRERWGAEFDTRWQESLNFGFVRETASGTVLPALDEDLTVRPDAGPGTNGLVLSIRPDPCIWDGAFSENAWMQETPRPLNKITWENAICVGPGLAAKRKLQTGDEVVLSAGDRSITGPVWVTPGQHDDVVALTLGYGRRHEQALAHGYGYDAYHLQTSSSPWFQTGISLRKTGETRRIATTQRHQAMDGYDFVRSVDLETPVIEAEEKGEGPSFYPDPPLHDPSWGMTVDLDLCIGCNACVTACQAENNVPVVGRDLVAEGREMHWMRVDRYHEGDPADPKSYFQPVPCMHCEDAPCEMGCPVNAAVHSIDGLNLQVYNRCIGTRTCSSYCPYKVRRFNWFDYTGDDPESVRAMRNPQVTVRDRGVMEKCTYCVQRIADARIEADKENRPIRDGEIVTACQQACPTTAIVFGNVADGSSEVSERKADPRNYSLLKEANTRPRTTYLARIEAPSGGKAGT